VIQSRWHRPLLLRVVLVAAFLLIATVVAYAASFGTGFQAGVAERLSVNDKTLHLLAFTVLTFQAQILWRPSLQVVSLLAGLAVLLEVAQLLLPEREVALADLVASLSGVAVGALLAAPFTLLHARLMARPGP
jgi:hypothetical protein